MLMIFRRHVKSCKHRGEGRKYRNCRCPIWVDGFLRGNPIRIRESMKLEFRGEFFNFFNRPEFGMPAVTLNLPTTGKITATSIPNRQVQFALKLLW